MASDDLPHEHGDRHQEVAGIFSEPTFGFRIEFDRHWLFKICVLGWHTGNGSVTGNTCQAPSSIYFSPVDNRAKWPYHVSMRSGIGSTREEVKCSMAVGLKYTVPVVAYMTPALKRHASREVARRKRVDHRFSLSRYISEIVEQALSKNEEPDADPATQPHQEKPRSKA